jgi:adenylate kinase family enzyme
MTIDEQLKAANMNYLRAGATVANVIQELERELERMRERKVQQEFIDDKDEQIQKIVEFYNQVDELIQFYKLMNLNMKLQLTEACNYIIKTAQDDITQQKFLMKYLTLKNVNPHG